MMDPEVVTTDTRLRSDAQLAKSLVMRLVAAFWQPDEREEVTLES